VKGDENDRRTNVTLNTGLKAIGHKAFHNCKGLKQIEIPSSVISFGPNAFRGSGLECVRVPLSVTDMTESEGWNFADCTSLRLAYIPRRFKGRLLESVFQNCAPDLQIIYYDETMKFFDETLVTDDSSSINLVAVCTNDCRVSFKWKCSCEPMIKGKPYDYLSFEIDGVRQDFICGVGGEYAFNARHCRTRNLRGGFRPGRRGLRPSRAVELAHRLAGAPSFAIRLHQGYGG